MLAAKIQATNLRGALLLDGRPQEGRDALADLVHILPKGGALVVNLLLHLAFGSQFLVGRPRIYVHARQPLARDRISPFLGRVTDIRVAAKPVRPILRGQTPPASHVSSRAKQVHARAHTRTHGRTHTHTNKHKDSLTHNLSLPHLPRVTMGVAVLGAPPQRGILASLHQLPAPFWQHQISGVDPLRESARVHA